MMETLKLISEEISEVEYITEQKDGGKKDYKIKGVFMESDVKNRNGRVYPMEILQKEVKRYNKQYINEKRAFGELGHPDGPTVNLERASHMITALYPDGKSFVGEAKILSTPNGQIVKNLINDGAKLGVSSRGLGSLEQRGGAQYVKDDFQLATAADIVADPSAPEAFVEGIMEGVEWVYESGILKAQDAEQMQKDLKSARLNKLEETKLILWKKFVENL